MGQADRAIDHEVARYWRENGYDLRYYLEANWTEIGPDLVGKLHFLCGDMDNYYFNLPVNLMEEFLEATDNPAYGGSFRYGRPNTGARLDTDYERRTSSGDGDARHGERAARRRHPRVEVLIGPAGLTCRADLPG